MNISNKILLFSSIFIASCSPKTKTCFYLGKSDYLNVKSGQKMTVGVGSSNYLDFIFSGDESDTLGRYAKLGYVEEGNYLTVGQSLSISGKDYEKNWKSGKIECSKNSKNEEVSIIVCKNKSSGEITSVKYNKVRGIVSWNDGPYEGEFTDESLDLISKIGIGAQVSCRDE